MNPDQLLFELQTEMTMDGRCFRKALQETPEADLEALARIIRRAQELRATRHLTEDFWSWMGGGKR